MAMVRILKRLKKISLLNRFMPRQTLNFAILSTLRAKRIPWPHLYLSYPKKQQNLSMHPLLLLSAVAAVW